MHIGFLNPQGNFDPNDSYWTEHPDFGGQLVYVKEVALAMAAQGHTVDIITRQIIDDAWPEFADTIAYYPEYRRVRIVRIPCGPPHFLPKEALWPYLGTSWLEGILRFYQTKINLPDVFTAHYGDGGLVGALLHEKTGLPFTFTGHSLGAQKLDKLHASPDTLAQFDERFHFKERIMAERIAMNRAARIVTSTRQEQMEQYAHRAYHGAVDPAEADADRFAIIPPGVNLTIFSPQERADDLPVAERIEAALTRDIPESRRGLPLVLVSSRLDRKKNHMGVVQAFAQNPGLRATANLALVVRGLDNPLQQRDMLKSAEERAILDEIAAALDEHNLWPAVTSFPLNNQAELAAAYRVAAKGRGVFALTAHYEPFGLAPLEAMSCGLPAVVTRNGGPSESLFEAETDTRFGVLVDPADPAGIAAGLLEALSPDKWADYQQAGIRRITERYTWDRTAESYLHLLAGLAKQPPTPAAEPLPIPPYFTAPAPENDMPLADLAALYFTEG